MATFSSGLGWMFTALALFSLLGLPQPFRSRIYPGTTTVLQRAAAPVIFAIIAAACFYGAAIPMLGLVAVAGLAQIITARVRLRHSRSPIRAKSLG